MAASRVADITSRTCRFRRTRRSLQELAGSCLVITARTGIELHGETMRAAGLKQLADDLLELGLLQRAELSVDDLPLPRHDERER